MKKQRKKTTRKLTVYEHYSLRNHKEYHVPYIRLCGKWLEKAGFNIGKEIKVIVNNKKVLIIDTQSEVKEV